MNNLFKTNVSEMDILEKSISINRTILRAWALFSVAAQVFNIVRLLFFNDSKLSTAENRIYFVFYVFFLVICILFLFDLKNNMSVERRHIFYMIFSSLFLFWHTFYNMYDIYRTAESGCITIITIVTAFVIFSSLLAFKPIYAVSNMVICYGVFMLFLNSMSQYMVMIYFSFTVFLCMVIYCARYKDICIEISKLKILDDIKIKWMNLPRNLSAEQYELIREKGGYITFEWDIQKDCIYFSKEINDYFEYPAIISSFGNFVTSLERISEEQKKILYECMDNVKKGVNFQKQELLFPIKTGEDRWFEVRIITQTDQRERPMVGIGILSDIAELKARIAQLEQEIRMDLFTGLLNKAAIEHYGERRLKELKEDEILGMLIVDIDDFKKINDNYGHPAGDFVLKEIADIIRNEVPQGTKIGRIGGDEFIVLSVTKNIDEFCSFAEGLINVISQIKWQEIDIVAKCSIGLSASAANQYTYAELYRKADSALYEAKNAGKNQLKIAL